MTTLEAHVDPENPSRILLVSTLAQREMIKTIPGALWDRKRNRWHVPLAWTTCLALRATFGEDLVIGPTLNTWALSERTRRIEPALSVRELLDAPGDSDLYPHQRADVKFLIAAQQAILGNDPGVGKTASAIRAAVALWRAGESPFPVLIVTPNTVKRTWVREINRWWPGAATVVVGGTALQRRKQLDKVIERTRIPCALHRVTPSDPTTPKSVVEPATSGTFAHAIPSTHSDSAITHATGQVEATAESCDTSARSTSEASSESASKSTNNGSSGTAGAASSAVDQLKSLTTTTAPEPSEAPSAHPAISVSTAPTKTLTGSTEPV